MRAFSILEEAVSRKQRKLTKSPDILKQLSTHSKAIMINILQQMVIASLKESEAGPQY